MLFRWYGVGGFIVGVVVTVLVGRLRRRHPRYPDHGINEASDPSRVANTSMSWRCVRQPEAAATLLASAYP
jgi:hypothetical protein